MSDEPSVLLLDYVGAPDEPSPPSPPRRRREVSVRALVVGAVVLLLLGGGAGFLAGQRNPSRAASPAVLDRCGPAVDRASDVLGGWAAVSEGYVSWVASPVGSERERETSRWIFRRSLELEDQGDAAGDQLDTCRTALQGDREAGGG